MIFTQGISFIADILSVVSAIITVLSAIAIKKYYLKIVRQYSVEKLTLAEQHIHSSIETVQQLKRIYSSNNRGLSEKRLCGLYLDIEEHLNCIIFDLPASFSDIISFSTNAKEKIKLATKSENILSKSSDFEELDILLNTIILNLKKEKENIQRENMK